MAEGGDEHPERGGVEEPVGGGPPSRTPQQGPVLEEHGEPRRQTLDQRGDAVGVDEADPFRHRPDDPTGPCLSPRQQVEEAAEGAEEDHAHGGGHDDQDRCRRRRVPVQPGGDVEPVQDEESDQRQPEQHVEHDRRADALGAEGESGVGAAHAGLGEEAVAERGPRGRPPGGDVAEGEGGQVDPEQAEPLGTTGGEDRVGQLGVGGECGDLQQHAEGQIGDVDVRKGADLAAVTGDDGEDDVEDEEEDQHGSHAEADFTAHERAAVPPPRPRGSSSHRLVCRHGHHPPHVGTARPPGPAMLRMWPTGTRSQAGAWRTPR